MLGKNQLQQGIILGYIIYARQGLTKMGVLVRKFGFLFPCVSSNYARAAIVLL